MAIKLSPSIIQSGNTAVRSYNINGLERTTSPISELIPLNIYDLEAGKVKEFSIKSDIDFSLQVASFRADIKDDDGSILQDGTEQARYSYVQAIVNVLEQGRVDENINFFFTSYPSGVSNHIVFDHNKDFQIRVNKDVNRLTFFCKPIYLLDSIDVFVPNKDDDGNQSQQ